MPPSETAELVSLLAGKKHETDSGKEHAAGGTRKRTIIVICGSSLGSDKLQEIVHERVHDDHCILLGDTGYRCRGRPAWVPVPTVPRYLIDYSNNVLIFPPCILTLLFVWLTSSIGCQTPYRYWVYPVTTKIKYPHSAMETICTSMRTNKLYSEYRYTYAQFSWNIKTAEIQMEDGTEEA